jgi:hypothetical protein
MKIYAAVLELLHVGIEMGGGGLRCIFLSL